MPVEIRGLREFRRALNRAGADANKTVKEAHKVVGDFVKGKTPAAASGRPPSRGANASSRGARRLASSFKSVPTVKAARIISTLPDAWGQEYGSHQYRQFPAWVGQNPGMVGGEAVQKNTPEIIDMYGDAVMDAFKKAYPLRG